MRIINNKIYINVGETPTYDVNVVDINTGEPLILTKGDLRYYVIFSVKDNVYSKTDSIIKIILDCNKINRFDSTQIINYNKCFGLDNQQASWNDDFEPDDEDINKLFKRTYGKTSFYGYYDNVNGKWVDYSFRITFPFTYDMTSKLKPITYKYDINLIGCESRTNDELNKISYKKTLMSLNDFIVGGSLSE